MRNEDKKVILSVAVALIAATTLVVLGFGGGYLLAIHNAQVHVGLAAEGQPPPGVDFSPVWKAWSVIDDKFVPASVATTSPLATTTEKLNQQKVWGMISGLASSLNDPYTFFLPPVESKQFASDLKGSFEGVGMEIDVKDQVLVVVSPLKGTPASRAGIKAGDQILKIDGQSTQGMDSSTAVDKIRGPKGTKVVLTIMRAGLSAPKEISVVRDVINVPLVITTARPDGVFVIQLAEFTANSPDLMRNALREYLQSGDTKLVLDLRGNPGGYLEAAVNIGSWFLSTGKVIVTEDYAGHDTNIVHRSYGYDVLSGDLKMVILVDKGSASASEILAGALRYWGVAKLIGTNTFGKGSVQEVVDITPDTSLKLTVARWLGPDGTQIPREGIVPDYQVDFTDADHTAGHDPQMDAAVALLLKGTIPATATTTKSH